MSVGDLLVGAGTIALAAFTWRLARQTQRDVEETTKSVGLTRTSLELSREGLDLNRQGLQAADMPYVIPSDSPLVMTVMAGSNSRTVERERSIRLAEDGPDGKTFDVRLWNIGKGPAIVTSVRLIVGSTRVIEAPPAPWPIAAGQDRDVSILMVDATFVPAEASNVLGRLEVDYLHSDGTLFQTTCDVRINRLRLTCESYRRSAVDMPAGV